MQGLVRFVRLRAAGPQSSSCAFSLGSKSYKPNKGRHLSVCQTSACAFLRRPATVNNAHMVPQSFPSSKTPQTRARGCLGGLEGLGGERSSMAGKRHRTRGVSPRGYGSVPAPQTSAGACLRCFACCVRSRDQAHLVDCRRSSQERARGKAGKRKDGAPCSVCADFEPELRARDDALGPNARRRTNRTSPCPSESLPLSAKHPSRHPPSSKLCVQNPLPLPALSQLRSLRSKTSPHGTPLRLVPPWQGIVL